MISLNARCQKPLPRFNNIFLNRPAIKRVIDGRFFPCNVFSLGILHPANSEHLLDGLTVPGISDRLVDVAEVIELHEAVKRKLPGLI